LVLCKNLVNWFQFSFSLAKLLTLVNFFAFCQHSGDGEEDAGSRVVEVKLSGAGNGGINNYAQWRRIIYGFVTPFAVFRIKRIRLWLCRNCLLALSLMLNG